jgi:hypothetical protein
MSPRGREMVEWIFKKIEPLVQAAITKRIIVFHDALVSRGQIDAISGGHYKAVGSEE